jgi:hypothetical protein
MTRPEASALLAAYEVEDFLCRAFNSRAERLAALKDIILGAIERSMPIPPSDSVALPSAVPAGPPAVESPPAVPPEDMPIAPAVLYPCRPGPIERSRQRENEEAAAKLRGAVHYNPETGEFFWTRDVSSTGLAGMPAGHPSGDGYYRIRLDNITYQAHRVAWLLHYGVWPIGEVEHDNGDIGDNRIANLKLSNRSIIASNAAMRHDNKTGVVGVRFREDHQLWTAQIQRRGKRLHLGSFQTKEEAVAARLKALAEMPPADAPEFVPPATPIESLPVIAPPALPMKKDVIRELFTTTSMSLDEIAAAVGSNADAVRASLSHSGVLTQPRGQGPVLIPAGRTKPSVKSKPYDPRPGRLAGITITAPGKVVAVDTVNFVVACPGGDWQTSRPVALIMERMRNGEMFGNDILATVGNLPPSVFAESKHRWTEELAKRGVNFIHIKGVGCRIEIAEGSAS